MQRVGHTTHLGQYAIIRIEGGRTPQKTTTDPTPVWALDVVVAPANDSLADPNVAVIAWYLADQKPWLCGLARDGERRPHADRL